MKRAGHLLCQIAELENLRLAFWKAAKGKRSKPDCRLFQEDLKENLTQLREALLSGRAQVGDYRQIWGGGQRVRTA